MRSNAPRRSAYDVVILGGGPAGCATALALRQRGVSGVLVAESGHYEADRVGESIPPDTRLLLQELGLWEDFLNEKHDPCLGSCSSWGNSELGYNDFLFNPYGNGWHLDRRRFNAFLANKGAQGGAEVCTGTRFKNGERLGNDGFRLQLSTDDGATQTVDARFVVDATGMRAVFAWSRGAKKQFLDLLICVYGFFELPEASAFSRMTMLEAVEYGWWYAAKLPNRRLAAAVASDSAFIKNAGLRKQHHWLAGLAETRHVADLLADCRFIEDSLLVCPTPSFLLDRVAGDRWLAVGDAASAYDPIAAQGIHKSLSDGLQAAEVIVAFLGGDAKPLDAYRSSVATRFEHYLNVRNYFYGLEKRWPDSPFWKRRYQRTAL